MRHKKIVWKTRMRSLETQVLTSYNGYRNSRKNFFFFIIFYSSFLKISQWNYFLEFFPKRKNAPGNTNKQRHLHYAYYMSAISIHLDEI